MERPATRFTAARASSALHFRRLAYQLRTEGATPTREAAAVGLGVLIGCSPFYGMHLASCWVVGRLLGLNRLKMYLAANVSNPLVAPMLILAEVQAGAIVRRGELHAFTLEAIRATDPWVFGADFFVGSAVVGAALGSLAAALTWLSARRPGRDPAFDSLVRRAADRYVSTSITAWEFARGKLRGDPVYRRLIIDGILPSGGCLADVGCGQGLMLALVAEAADQFNAGTWPTSWHAPPMFDRLVGVEMRRRPVAIARRALAEWAVIVEGDARTIELPRCSVILLLDVLHLMTDEDQRRVLRRVANSLTAGGIIVVREADAGAGWRFRAVQIGNRMKAFAAGNWRQPFCFRRAADWSRWFGEAGFEVDARSAGEGTPFGNVLFVLRFPSPERSSSSASG